MLGKTWLSISLLLGVVGAAVIATADAVELPYCGFKSEIQAIRKGIQSKETTCVELIKAYLDRATKYGADLNAYIGGIQSQSALKQAALLDNYYLKNKQFKGKLHCVPVVVKDNMDIAGLPTTAGAKVLANSVPQKDSTIWQRMRSAGAVLIAKTNMGEFAEGWPIGVTFSSSDSEEGGLARNAWGAPGTNFSTDGSSGGSALALSLATAVAATGSDTGGSIQAPASTNNVFGIRPPLNFVPADGVVPSFYLQDAPGPMARRARDAIILLDVMAGSNFSSSGMFQKKKLWDTRICNLNFLQAVPKQPIPGVDIPSNLVYQDGVMERFNDAVATLKKLGATVVPAIEGNFMELLTYAATVVTPLQGKMRAARDACFDSCQAWSWDKYFNDSARFGKDAPFHSAADIAASPLLPSVYSKRMHEVLNNTMKLSPEAFCNLTCQTENKYDATRKEIQDWMQGIMDDKNCTMLIGATWPYFPINMSDPNTPLEFGPSTYSPYAGWPAVVVPMGFSEPSEAAPKGLPIGLDIMSSPERFRDMLELAMVFQDAHSTVTLPKNAPALQTNNPVQTQLFNCDSI